MRRTYTFSCRGGRGRGDLRVQTGCGTAVRNLPRLLTTGRALTRAAESCTGLWRGGRRAKPTRSLQGSYWKNWCQKFTIWHFLTSWGSVRTKIFFGRILERKWLLDNYVQAVISAIKLPDQINFIQISAMPYEGRAVRTRIFFSERQIPTDMPGTVYFRCERTSDLIRFNTESMRLVRKLMEVSGADAGLWVKLPERVIEGSVMRGSAAEQTAGLCVVFEGALVWSIHKAGENILTYREGNYIIPAMQPDVDKYADLGKMVSFGRDFEIPDKMDKLQQIVRRVASVQAWHIDRHHGEAGHRGGDRQQTFPRQAGIQGRAVFARGGAGGGTAGDHRDRWRGLCRPERRLLRDRRHRRRADGR